MLVQTPVNILKTHWGYSEFKGSQEKIIAAILAGKDVLALMPTGGGKSVCFQVPALVKKGICIVVSPLIALIQNQVNSLKEKGIKAIALTGGIPQNELIDLLDNCCFGNYSFLYLSPERLKQELVQDRIRQMDVNLIAIDEAHCISQWGHDFRPAYLECVSLRELAPQAPIIALTATATAAVSTDIISALQLDEAMLVKDSFARTNIAFEVVKTEDKKYKLKTLCNTTKGSTIVYVRTRRNAQDLSNYLNNANCTATFFHGGIAKEEKTKRLDLWLSNKVQTMVATNAFGMGIDKADVGLVIHYQIPDCIENYFQEAGRAGRNGKAARAILLTNDTDQQEVKNQFLSVLPDIAFIKTLYKKLNNYFQVSYGELPEEAYQLNFNAFCDTYQLNTMLAFNAFRILDQHSVISLHESFAKKTTVQMLANKQQLFEYLEKNRNLVGTVQTLLRTYGGIFDFVTKVNLFLIAKKAKLPEASITNALEVLQNDGIIAYEAHDSDLSIRFLVPREDAHTINSFGKKVLERHQLKAHKIDRILAYTLNDKKCRSEQLLHYFDETETQACGNCDVCQSRFRSTTNTTEISEQILNILLDSKCNSRTLVTQLNCKEAVVLEEIKKLLEDGKIKINGKNEYEIL